MKINRYIKDLLFTNDRVIVPDFGAFIVKYHAAKISDTQSTMFPPRKELTFDPNLVNDDGILVNYLVEQGKITPVEARQLVSEFVKDTHKQLEAGQQVFWSDLGTFSIDEEKNLSFEADKNSNFLLDSYGMDSFQTPIIEKEVQTEAPEEEEKSRKWLYIALAAVALILISIYPIKKFIIDKNASDSRTEIVSSGDQEGIENGISDEDLVSDSEAHNAVSDSASAENLPPENDQNAETDTESDQTQHETPDGSTSGKPYHVIAGSFKHQSNAQKKLKDLKKQGYSSARVLAPVNGFYRVSIGGFATEQEARRQLNSLTSKGIADAWFLAKE